MTALIDTLPCTTTTRCSSYEPGHRLHWSTWSMAQFAPAVTVSRLDVAGPRLDVEIGGQHAFTWQHHDPEHLAFALAHATGPAFVLPTHRVVHVGGAWFSCAAASDVLAPCC